MVKRAIAGRVPTLAEWEPTFSQAYEPKPIGNEYEAYSRRMLEMEVDTAPTPLRIERVINLCVEGHARQALAELEAIGSKIAPTRRVAYHRLRGALLREMGDSEGALAAYADARRALTRPSALVEKALAFDMLSVRDDEDFFSELEKIRKMPGDTVTPAIDHYRTVVADEFADDLFNAHVGVTYFGGIGPDRTRAVLAHNASLAYAYLIGDYSEVQAARQTFARFVMSSMRHPEAVANAVRELVHARDAKAVKSALEVHAHRIHALMNVAELARTLRPTGKGSAAEPVWATLLAIIDAASDYLDAEARRSVSSEMLARSVEYLRGENPQMVLYHSRQGFRSESAFVQAFQAVADLSERDVERLVTELAASPREQLWHWSMWKVLGAHEWRTTDATAAEKAVATLRAMSLAQDSALYIVSLALKISESYPELRASTCEWILATQWSQAPQVWALFMRQRYASAVPRVRGWIEGLVNELESDLRSANARAPLSFPARSAGALPAAFHYYRDQFKPDDAEAFVKRLVEAGRNPNAFVELKAGVYQALARLIDEVPDAAKAGRIDVGRATEDRSRVLPGDVTEVLAQTRLLELRIALGFEPCEAEAVLVLDALRANDARTRQAGLSACAHALRRGKWAESAPGILAGALGDESYVVRSAAAVLALRSGIAFLSTFGVGAFETILSSALSDTPYVAQTVLYALAEPSTKTPEEFRERVLAVGRAAAQNAHSGVRRAGVNLVSRFS